MVVFVLLRYNYRLYPAPGQRIALGRAFGCARVVFNDALAARRAAFEGGLPYIGDGDLAKQVITEAKKTPGRTWLAEVSAVVLQQALGSGTDRPGPYPLCRVVGRPQDLQPEVPAPRGAQS